MKNKTSINKEIAIRAKSYRKRSGHSQEDIADMLGLTRVSYVNMENGRHGWTATNIYNLCRIFGCKPTSLFPMIRKARIKSKIVTRKRIRVVVIRNPKPKKRYLKI